MKLSMEQFRDRLVDYLYGELDGDALRDFESCLAESDACRSELAAFQRTLRHARGALQADSAPPARVRSAVLAAARVAAEENVGVARAARVLPMAAAPAPKRAREDESGGSWAWLRAPWLLPAFGVAAAVTLVVLNKEVRSPDMHRSERVPAAPIPAAARREVESAPASDSLAAPAQPPAEGVALNKPQPHAGLDGVGSSGAAQPARRRGGAAARAASKGYAAPPPAWSPERAAKREARDVEDERVAQDRAPPPPPRKTADKSNYAPAPVAPAAEPSPGGFGGGMARESAEVAAPAASAAPQGPVVAEKKRVELPTREQLMLRARQQTDAQSYGEAWESYAELLRRFPSDRLAPSWRKSQTELRALQDGAR